MEIAVFDSGTYAHSGTHTHVHSDTDSDPAHVTTPHPSPSGRPEGGTARKGAAR
ncbi:hypothetical protein NKH77_32415 [Streptomyces sp. M19]